MSTPKPAYAPIGLQHVNLSVPPGTLPLAQAFYGTVLGLANDAVPELQRDVLLWFALGGGQQIHISQEKHGEQPRSSRHPCFALPDGAALYTLQQRIYAHHLTGGRGAARECDVPGEDNSGAKGKEYPDRFFAYDFAGNRLEFAVHAM